MREPDAAALGERADTMIRTLGSISAEPNRLVRLFLTPEHRAAEAAALAVDVLGGGVDDDIGAPLERPLQHRRGEGIVEHDLGGLRLRGGVGVHLDPLVTNEHDDVGHALVGADGQYLIDQFVLAADLDILVGLEFGSGWCITTVQKPALDRAPLLGTGHAGGKAAGRHERRDGGGARTAGGSKKLRNGHESLRIGNDELEGQWCFDDQSLGTTAGQRSGTFYAREPFMLGLLCNYFSATPGLREEIFSGVAFSPRDASAS